SRLYGFFNAQKALRILNKIKLAMLKQDFIFNGFQALLELKSIRSAKYKHSNFYRKTLRTAMNIFSEES
ncbi:MAG: hypothetical protein AAF599_18665, partial [Bacteroidota bacterium]